MVCPFPLILYFLHPNPSVPAIQQNLLLLTKWHSVSLTCCVAATVVSAPYPQTTAVQEPPPRKKGSPGCFSIHFMTRSWKVAVLSLAHCHELASVCPTVVAKLRHFDESSVSVCWYRVYDTIPSRLLSVGTFSETVKTLWRLCKTECKQQRLDRKMLRLQTEVPGFFWYTWHHSITTVSCWHSLQNCWILQWVALQWGLFTCLKLCGLTFQLHSWDGHLR